LAIEKIYTINKTKNDNKTNPSILVNQENRVFPSIRKSLASIQIIIAANKLKGISFRTVFLFVAKG
jgi:hypothetical protein